MRVEFIYYFHSWNDSPFRGETGPLCPQTHLSHTHKENANLLCFSVLSSRLRMGWDRTDADEDSLRAPVAVVMCDSRQDCACNWAWSGSGSSAWMRILTRLTGIVAQRGNWTAFCPRETVISRFRRCGGTVGSAFAWTRTASRQETNDLMAAGNLSALCTWHPGVRDWRGINKMQTKDTIWWKLNYVKKVGQQSCVIMHTDQYGNPGGKKTIWVIGYMDVLVETFFIIRLVTFCKVQTESNLQSADLTGIYLIWTFTLLFHYISGPLLHHTDSRPHEELQSS